MHDEGASHTEGASDCDLFSAHVRLRLVGWLQTLVQMPARAGIRPACECTFGHPSDALVHLLPFDVIAGALIATCPFCQCTCRRLSVLPVHFRPLSYIVGALSATALFARALAATCPSCQCTCRHLSVLPVRFRSLSYIAGALQTSLRFVGAPQVHKQGRIMYPECTGKIKTGRKCTENTGRIGQESQKLEDGDPSPR